MTTWRGCTCSVGYCGEPASLDIHALPLCHQHGMEVARALSGSIIAEYELKQARRASDGVERRESDQGNREGGTVYYARIGGYIKIGYSARLRRRLASLRIDELLAIEPGDPALERVRHGEFSEERIDLRRENFRPSERLDAHISDLRAKHGLPRWATLPRTSIVTRATKEES